MINLLTTQAAQYSLNLQQDTLWQNIMDFFYNNWFILMIFSVVIVLGAQIKVQSTTAKYSKVASMRNLTGEEVATRILHSEGIYDVEVKPINGSLTDNYNPGKKTVFLSEDVFNKNSIVAVSVAAHEVGHAIQHNKNYFPLKLRQFSFYFARAGSAFTGFTLLLAFIANIPALLWLGILGITAALIFQLFTLPVEFNASKRAKVKLDELGLVTEDEGVAVKEVLNAAALTYLAAMVSTLITLMRILAVVNRR